MFNYVNIVCLYSINERKVDSLSGEMGALDGERMTIEEKALEVAVIPHHSM